MNNTVCFIYLFIFFLVGRRGATGLTRPIIFLIDNFAGTDLRIPSIQGFPMIPESSILLYPSPKWHPHPTISGARAGTGSFAVSGNFGLHRQLHTTHCRCVSVPSLCYQC